MPIVPPLAPLGPLQAGQQPAAAASARPPGQTASAGKSKDVFRQFEAFVLQSFITEMLPKNAVNVFGKGTAGAVWKSMLAEKLAAEIVKGGGLGIAEKIAAGAGAQARSASPVSVALLGSRPAAAADPSPNPIAPVHLSHGERSERVSVPGEGLERQMDAPAPVTQSEREFGRASGWSVSILDTANAEPSGDHS